ncbi:MAG: type I restriction endonuclease [Chloroflexi bacterium]|nr:type I restriction endonuclease [Chloroflexota bacterium]
MRTETLQPTTGAATQWLRGAGRSAEQIRRDPQSARDDLRHGSSGSLWRRRAIVGASLVGLASMAATTLLQTGIVRHLPDPPLPGFNSDQVNLSDTAFPFGIPDGSLALLAFAANLPLTAFGGADRAYERPWLSLAIAAKAAADAAVSGWYFYQMPAREKAWCGYCITAAFASFVVLALSIPEAQRAVAALWSR